MCGINGLFLSEGRSSAEMAPLIAAMNKALAHRGPDDEGYWHDHSGRVHLGHRRLSIIDLSPAGHQPMISPTGDAIVFNGEIYNYRDIRKKLEGFDSSSASDTAVLLELCRKKWTASTDSLNGMYAFAYWSESKQTLFLARDRSGKKPLYFTNQNGVFAFSSEIKALLTLPWIKNEPDEEALYHFLTFNQLPPPFTLFKGIQKLGPSEFLLVNNGISRQHYWEPQIKDLSKLKEEDAAGQVLESLRESVKYRMVSDVPVGAFLSGGVDSSAVVALMRENSDQSIKTYSVGFDGQPDYDERKHAEKISALFQTEHYEKIVKPEDIAGHLDDIVNAFDEPMADATCIPIYFISQLARQHQTIVVQTGDGADELFAGYSGWKKYKALYPAYEAYSRFPAIIRKGVAALAGEAGSSEVMQEMLSRAANKEEFFWGGARAFKESNKRSFLNAAYLQKSVNWNSSSVIHDYQKLFNRTYGARAGRDPLDWMCYLGYRFQIPSKYLHRMDRLGMAHSIEIRCPFLDYNVVNLALSLPGRYKINNGTPKYILKKSLEKILPHETLYRKKMGFCVPLKEWAGDIMLDYTQQHLRSFAANTGFFNEEGLQHLIRQIKTGNTSYTNQLWTVYFLMAWFKKWMHL
jgi:asparagine synthase (glutamine-hydrolysing)